MPSTAHNKTTYINTRIAPTLKAEAEHVLERLGVSTSEAITMFLSQVVLHQGLPFPLRVPNAETTAALREAREQPETLIPYQNVDDMMKDVWPDLREAKNILLDQSTIHADARTFQKVMDWMDSAATPAETDGMKRLQKSKAYWKSG